MVFVCGLLARNGFCSMEVRLVVRKFCMMGPQSPCGSSTNVSRIVFALRRSPRFGLRVLFWQMVCWCRHPFYHENTSLVHFSGDFCRQWPLIFVEHHPSKGLRWVDDCE